MRGAPGFKAWPDPVDGRWKWELLAWLGATCGIDTLIETGTCEGSTPFALASNFKEIYTCELHDGLYEVSKKRLAGLSNVRLYHESSPQWLRGLLPRIPPEVPLLFWLDAHSSGPHTADDGDPLANELRAIYELCPNPLVVVDDQIDASFQRLVAGGLSLDGWIKEYRTGEVIMHKGGYSIPPFEDFK